MDTVEVEVLSHAAPGYVEALSLALSNLSYESYTLHNGGSQPSTVVQVEGEAFFVKRHLSPKIPVRGRASQQNRRERCVLFSRRIATVIARLDVARTELPARPLLLARQGGTFLSVHKFIPGRALSPDLFGQLPDHLQVSILDSLASQIEVLHSAGLAHLDVQPQNAIIANRVEDGVAVLIDLDNCVDFSADPSNLEGVRTDLVYSPRNVADTDFLRPRDSYAFSATALALASPKAFRLWAARSTPLSGLRGGPTNLEFEGELGAWGNTIRAGLEEDPDRRADISDLRHCMTLREQITLS